MIEKILILYLIIINLIGFCAMGSDKHRAIKHQRRTPEKRLFMYALLGGSVGCILAMVVYHHKTKHPSFVIGMPTIFVIQVLIIAAAYYLL